MVIRLDAFGAAGYAPDSSAARLRRLENGGGISCSPSRSGWTSGLERASPRSRIGDYAILAEYDPARRSTISKGLSTCVRMAAWLHDVFLVRAVQVEEWNSTIGRDHP